MKLTETQLRQLVRLELREARGDISRQHVTKAMSAIKDTKKKMDEIDDSLWRGLNLLKGDNVPTTVDALFKKFNNLTGDAYDVLRDLESVVSKIKTK